MNGCAKALVRRLAADGGWASRHVLEQGISYSEARVDEDLADLVAGGTVLFNPRGREYKLAGAQYARRALKLLIETGCNRRVLAGQSADKQRMQFGIATRTQDIDGAELLVMAELDFPYPTGPDAMPQLYHGLLSALDSADRLHAQQRQQP